MLGVDREALATALAETDMADYGRDPGGESEWIAALVAWEIDLSGKRLDPATLAERISTIWSVGNLVEKELAGRFQVRATENAQFPYLDPDGELQAGIIGEHRLKTLSDDPRELACAIAAEVVRVAKPEHNVVLFRRLLTKTALYSHPVQYRYDTKFALARVLASPA
jgi:hypothetical protein